MRKNRINTTSIREIKSSFKRFLSLLVMSMLGVGVFIGIKMAAPDMLASLDKYYDDNNLYDVKIISTLGLTQDDIRSINNIDGVEKAYGSYSKDVLIKTGKKESVIKVMAITNDLNNIELKKGTFPKENNQIVVEENMIKRLELSIGDSILLEDSATFNETRLTIVGIVKSPLYISNGTAFQSRGTTNIGTGEINFYTYVKDTNFKLDYYTESYIKVKGAKEKTTNSKEYNELIDGVISNVNDIKSSREKARYNEVYNSVNEEIRKNEEAGISKLDNAKNILDASKAKLNNGRIALDNSKTKLDFAKETLDETKIKLDNAKLLLDQNKGKLDAGKKEIDDAKQKINEELKNYDITIEDIINFKDSITSDIVPDDMPYHDLIVSIINNGFNPEMSDFFKDLITNPDNIDAFIASIPPDTPNYEKIVKVLEIYKQDPEKFILLMDSINKIDEAEREYNEGLELYNYSLEKYNNGYNTYVSYYNEYQNGLSLYNNGLRNYNSNLGLYDSKVKEYYDGKRMFDIKISDAKKELDKIPECTWYVYTRLDDSGYSSFIDDGKSVSNLAKVFPTIFFVVAILISLISMSRMVEDDRNVIGTLKSLGFSNKHIRKKYLLYSGIATISGGILGSLLGFFLLPKFIWNIYKILFDVPVFRYDFNPTNVIIGITIALVCICGTTLLTIRKVVSEKPSDLMRPKAPANGKRVILERIPFIWKRINFSNKITVRNLFRYKKRVIMTVVGILGCTALMLAGFGIRDSIVGIPDKQYQNIFSFDELVYVTNGSVKNLDKVFDDKHINNAVYTNMSNNITANGYGVNLFVPNDNMDLYKIVNLKDVKTGNKLRIEENKVIISDKLSRLTNRKAGDRIVLKEATGKEHEFTISGVCENYVGHYVFMSKRTYEQNISDYEINMVYLDIDNLKNEERLNTKLIKEDNVMSVISVNSTISGVNDMLKSLNSVVAILIILSGALSFVVLYNLSYINISERKREIATLKVLGFTDKEVDKYITKETMILTIIGIVIGLVFGTILTSIILSTVEIEMVRFIRNIRTVSYVVTAFIVILFTITVNRIIHYTLKKIDMIESLKSVE